MSPEFPNLLLCEVAKRRFATKHEPSSALGRAGILDRLCGSAWGGFRYGLFLFSRADGGRLSVSRVGSGGRA